MIDTLTLDQAQMRFGSATPTFCMKCGREADHVGPEGDYATCDRCENEYQWHLALEYPWGQCQTCGAEYYPVVNVDGTVSTNARHVEGGCPNWDDPFAYEYDDEPTHLEQLRSALLGRMAEIADRGWRARLQWEYNGSPLGGDLADAVRDQARKWRNAKRELEGLNKRIDAEATSAA